MQERVARLEGEIGTLSSRVGKVEAVLFADPQTGAPGLVATTRELAEYVQALRITLRTLNWLLAFLGITGAGVMGALGWLVYNGFGGG